ncbi:hypothetical protein FSP39_023873 [Pinctada imbricata]|uniref:C2 domain-containing protein n=1 Tax=Pinctada imbricata TaxID=66713 RepID=A0AA88XNU4_PINIB|nr:hypothetical protein FSP39_023873 [Pinctada imbricata]
MSSHSAIWRAKLNIAEDWIAGEDPFSGATTPGSAGLKEMSFNFSTEKMDGLPPLTIKNNRQRRASMQDAIDLRKIDTKLYDRRIQRHRSFCSSTEEDASLGSINLRLQYNTETHMLSVEIVQAADLMPQGSGSSANPYCKVTLLPDHPSLLRTRVQETTLDPLFEEEFIFDVSQHKLRSCKLQILVMDSDHCTEDECLGQVKIPLDSIDFSDNSQLEIWRGLAPYEEETPQKNHNGEIMFSLTYLSSAERLTVVIVQARNLRHPDQTKVLDPSVKVSVLQNSKRIKKKKTSTGHGTENPMYNEALVFSISRDILPLISMEIQVCHENKLGNDDVIGRVKLGLDTTGEEKIHWNDLISSKGAVARWHVLH